MDQEIAAEMVHLAEYMSVPAVDDVPVSALVMQTRQVRARRRAEPPPW